MKTAFILLTLLLCSNCFSQDSSSFRSIDRFVALINSSPLKEVNKTFSPADSSTYSFLITDYCIDTKKANLKKVIEELGKQGKDIAKVTNYYFIDMELIKIEETFKAPNGSIIIRSDYYYKNDKPLMSKRSMKKKSKDGNYAVSSFHKKKSEVLIKSYNN